MKKAILALLIICTFSNMGRGQNVDSLKAEILKTSIPAVSQKQIEGFIYQKKAGRIMEVVGLAAIVYTTIKVQREYESGSADPARPQWKCVLPAAGVFAIGLSLDLTASKQLRLRSPLK